MYILDNYIQMSQAATALYLLDFGPSGWGLPGTLNAVDSGNLFVTDTSCGCYIGSDLFDYSVIVADGLASPVVSPNTILDVGSASVLVLGGPAPILGNAILGSYVGIWVASASGVNVLGNVINGSAEYGIAVAGGSSNTVVAYNLVKNSGVDDLYWDGTGTGNLWYSNIYGT